MKLDGEAHDHRVGRPDAVLPLDLVAHLQERLRLVRRRALAMSGAAAHGAFFGWSASKSLVTSSTSILEYQTFRKRIEA